MNLTKDELATLATLAEMGKQEFFDKQYVPTEQIRIIAKTIHHLIDKVDAASKDLRRQGRTSIDGPERRLARLAKRYGIAKREQAKIPFPEKTN